MQNYIPDESFPSQYPEWKCWKADSFRKLPATKDLKQQGALLFIEGKITELKPMGTEAGFEGCIEDDKAYGTWVWIHPEHGDVSFDCGCARPRKEDYCPHALAMLAAVDYIFFERNHLSLSPLSENIEQLAEGIDRSERNKDQILRRIRLCGLYENAPYLEGDAALSEGFIEAFYPYGVMHRFSRNTLELPTYKLRETLRILVDFVRDHRGMRLEAETPEGDFLTLTPELAEVGARLHFILDEATNLIRMEETAEALEPEAILAQLDEKHYILRDGRIACIDENYFQPLKRAFFGSALGFSDFSHADNEIMVEHYNFYAAQLKASERRLLRKCKFSVQSNGEKTSIPAADNLAKRKVELRLELHRAKENEWLEYDATIDGFSESAYVELSCILSSFMHTLMNDASDATRFFGRRKRVSQLLEAASHLPTLSTESERRRFINKVSQSAIYKKAEHKRVVGQFLRKIEQDYCRPKSAVVQMCWPQDALDEASPYHWQPVELPLPALLAIIAQLHKYASIHDWAGPWASSIRIKTEANTLVELAEICEHFDISLRIDNQSTLVRPALVEVLCASTEEIDWFELKPSVRCHDLEIPPEDWERLLAGTLILQAEDGSLVAPKINRAEALEGLIQTLGNDSKGQAIARVHRLHMLDWIALRQSGVELDLPEELEKIFQSLREFERIPTQPLPATIQAELRPYQQQGFEWLIFLHQHRFGACLADDMGLGKTLQTLCFLAYLQSQASSQRPLRALAVLPTSLLFNWQSEAARFLPKLTVASYSGTERDPAVFDQSELVLTSYDLLWRDLEHFKKHSFDLVIFDEAQALKNQKSRRTQAAEELERRFTLCLTGTPMENHAGEFHTIMNLALPGLMGSRKSFDESLRSGDEHRLRRARPFLLRRTKDAILKELPPKVESDIHLEMNEDQRSIYTRIVDELRKEVAAAYQTQTKAQAGISALTALTKLRQICVCPSLIGHSLKEPAPKIQHLVDNLLELREEGQSALIFSQFVKVLDVVQDSLKKAGVQAIRLDGSTPAKKRKQAVDRFQSSKQAEIFLISLKAGGVGLNLTRASHVFHIDPWWNPAVENQASDRAHRIGQQHTVFVQRLIMRDSIEEKIMVLKTRKKKLFHAIIEDPAASRQTGVSITKEDFEFLLGS